MHKYQVVWMENLYNGFKYKNRCSFTVMAKSWKDAEEKTRKLASDELLDRHPHFCKNSSYRIY